MLSAPTLKDPALKPELMGIINEYLGHSLEELIGHAHRGATEPHEDITLSDGGRLSQQDKQDFYAAISKQIYHAVHQLKNHQVQIIEQPGDEPYVALARIVNELQRRAESLLGNWRISDGLKTQLRAIDTPETQEAHSIEQLIQMNAVLNSMDKELFDAARPQDLNATKISLRRSGLTCLTPRIIEVLRQYTQLQALNLRGNQLTTLPESIGQLTQLQQLDVNSNQLTKVPESLGQLDQLQCLYLYNNQLTTVPESVGKIAQLQILRLELNQLTALPESIGQLTELRTLSLDYNQLATLPECIGKLTELRRLSLDHNQLTTLPESIGQLTWLDSVTLHNNPFTSLPECMRGILRKARMLQKYGHLLSKSTTSASNPAASSSSSSSSSSSFSSSSFTPSYSSSSFSSSSSSSSSQAEPAQPDLPIAGRTRSVTSISNRPAEK